MYISYIHLLLSIMAGWTRAVDQPSGTEGQIIYIIPNNDNEVTGQVGRIIDALQKLNFLDQDPANCYQVLDRVSKRTDADHKWIINMQFHVRRVPISNNENVSCGTTVPTSTATALHTVPTSGADIGPVTNTTSQENSTSKPAHDLKKPDSKKTGDSFVKQLSKSQILVITTCSTTIGIFFIIAMALRLRNYFKRQRHQEELAKRPTFRSTSMALRRSSSLHTPNKAAHSKVGIEDPPPVTFHDPLQPNGKVLDISKPLLVITAAVPPPVSNIHKIVL